MNKDGRPKISVVGIEATTLQEKKRIVASSVSEAANIVDGQSSHISECMHNVPHRNTHKGYTWRQANE